MLDDFRLLVRNCLGGDQSAMATLVEQFRGKVFGLCFRMLGQRQDAEDVVQETFIRVLKSLGRWDPSREFEPWVLAIAGNRCRTALAARQRRFTNTVFEDAIPDPTPNQQAANQLREEVDLGLHRLRPEYRLAFELFHDQELSYESIAQRMNVPLGTVKTWVHRARKELIQHLAERQVVEGARDALSGI